MWNLLTLNWRCFPIQCNIWKNGLFYKCFQEVFVKNLTKKVPHLNTKFQESFQHVCIIASSCVFIFKVLCSFVFLLPFSFQPIVVVAVYKCFHEVFVKNLVKKVSHLNTKFQHLVQHVYTFASRCVLYLNFMYLSIPSSLLEEATAYT